MEQSKKPRNSSEKFKTQTKNSSKKFKVSANPHGLLAENTSKKGWSRGKVDWH